MAANEEFKLKDKDISLATKSKLVYSSMFRVVTFGSESWTLFKANQWKLNAFEMWTWKRLLKISSTDKKTNDWVLKSVQTPHVVTQHHLLWQTKVLRTYPKSRSQLGKVNQVGNGEREKRRERPNKRWLNEVKGKNGTQTRCHIKPSYK